jgi:hypothetical protein
MTPDLRTSRRWWAALLALFAVAPLARGEESDLQKILEANKKPGEGSATVEPGKPGTPGTPAAAKPPKDYEQNIRDKNKLFDFLMKEYRALLTKTKDRLGRSLTVACIGRVPRSDATTELLSLLKNERDPLVRTVAWECLLARANGLRESEFKQWALLTPSLYQAGAFRGELRVPFLQVLALSPPDAFAKEAFSKIFRETNSTDPEDAETIVALGATMRAWGEPSAAEAVLNRLSDINDATRAEIVMHAAGADVPYAIGRRDLGSAEMWKRAQADYAAWWEKEKTKWVPIKGRAESGEWSKLQAQYIPRVDMAAAVDPSDKAWYRDLELRAPNLKTFSVGLLLDTTGSMGDVIVWLRSDVKRMMQALGIIALEPQITLTLYRDFGDAYVKQTLPLTGRYETLVAALSKAEAKGGGDLPEAVREAMQDSLANGNWPASKVQPKAMVLIGDAPPHPETQAECEQIAKDLAAKGFRLYTVKTMTGYESMDVGAAFDKLAEAGGGASLWSDMRRNGGNQPVYRGRAGGGYNWQMGGGGSGIDRLAGRTEDSTANDEASAGEWIVTKVVTDAVNPQFSHRVRPPVAILWQMLKEPTVEQHQPFPPPPPKRQPENPTMREPMKPKDPPKDVQAR